MKNYLLIEQDIQKELVDVIAICLERVWAGWSNLWFFVIQLAGGRVSGYIKGTVWPASGKDPESALQ